MSTTRSQDEKLEDIETDITLDLREKAVRESEKSDRETGHQKKRQEIQQLAEEKARLQREQEELDAAIRRVTSVIEQCKVECETYRDASNKLEAENVLLTGEKEDLEKEIRELTGALPSREKWDI